MMGKKDAINLTNVDADIKEDDIQQLDPEVLEVLLVDHTRSRALRQQTGNPDARANIYWCTNDYKSLGEGYAFFDEIRPELITGDNHLVVQPRVLKSKAQQEARIKDKAEVFTPSWVCNAQNNLVDEAWFGRKEVFNREVILEDGVHSWEPVEGSILFPEENGKSWSDYIRDTRMEITCGEAPYLCSRYDTTTGELIPVERRIGLLDRKLRVVSENTTTSKEFLEMAQAAYENTYGFEWQGDSLLIARESLLWTFIEYYLAKFGKRPNLRSIRYIAYVISWNLWQMDGLKYVVPGSCDNVYRDNLMGEREKVNCPACKKGTDTGHIGIKCLVRDWPKFHNKSRYGKDAEKKYTIPFVQLVHGVQEND
jgi:hypothetical protein